jgi:hypothetical protein
MRQFINFERLRLRFILKEYGADIAAISSLVLFSMIFFWRAIFGGEIIIHGDPAAYAYPLRMAAWEAIRNGSLPLWTPLLLSGYPLLSMAQVAIGYPLTWGYLFLPGHWAEQIFVLAPHLLAPIFTYAYAREVGRSRLASTLASLSFGYGGLMISGIGLSSLMPNAVMWLPLFLIAIERARTRRFIPCLLSAAAAYTMSVLAGFGQGFTYAGALALAYGVFVALYPRRPGERSEAEAEKQDDWRNWKPLIVLSNMAVIAPVNMWTRQRLRPLAVAAGGIVLAAGVAAFQILETLRAAKSSVRAKLNYGQFVDGSFPPALAFRSWLQPLYSATDVTLYAAPLATGLAIAAVLLLLRRSRRHPLIIFWAIVAVVSFFMILGYYSPINRTFYAIPFINRFRVPSRHTFEWTFALSILGAFGWDAISELIAKRSGTASAWRARFGIALGIVSLAAAVVVGFSWHRFSTNPLNDIRGSFEIFQTPYLGWKAAFTLLIFVSAWRLCRMKSVRLRTGLLASVIAVACFIEPFIAFKRWVPGLIVPSSRFSAFAPTTEFLRQFPPEQNRVYSDISPFAGIQSERPNLDSVNWTAIAGLHHVAGYEPLIGERYSRALNNFPWETVNRAPSLGQDPTLFDSKSHVLDLLNTTFAIVQSRVANGVAVDGIGFSAEALGVDVKSDKPTSLACDDGEGDTLALVTNLGVAGDIPDKEIVARVSIHTSDGRIIERQLRAGVDTAEWAHERPDVKATIKHSLAPVFDSYPGDANNTWQGHRFLARIDLGERARIKRVEIIKTQTEAGLGLWWASFYDSSSRRSTPFSLSAEKWETIYQKDGVKILRNTAALPRAWLVTEARAVGTEEAWAAIRGLSARPFDPRRTALLELDPNKIPALSGRSLSDNSYARIVTYEPNRLTIETRTDQPAVLVVSEMHYPGWVATIDGVKTHIHNTDFLLRGIVAPAGLHRIEMQYKAPGARNGAIISLFTLLLIASLAVYAKRESALRSRSGRSAPYAEN